MAGIVYVLTNPAMPGLVKIGKTNRDEVTERISEFNRQTCVPVPFECVVAVQVDDEAAIEKALHIAFDPDRINPKREFFEIDARQAEALLKVCGKDVTPNVKQESEAASEQVEKDARKTLAARRRGPQFSFAGVGIQVGETITSLRGSTAEVADEGTSVLYGNKEMSLRKATIASDGSLAGKPLRPASYWHYNGTPLIEMYDSTHKNNDETQTTLPLAAQRQGD